MKLVVESGVMRATGTLGVAVDELRWPRALRPGSTVRVRGRALEKRDSSKPERGIMRFKLELVDQDDLLLMSEIPTLLVTLRPR